MRKDKVAKLTKPAGHGKLDQLLDFSHGPSVKKNQHIIDMKISLSKRFVALSRKTSNDVTQIQAAKVLHTSRSSIKAMMAVW